jgi:hypothetical protein
VCYDWDLSPCARAPGGVGPVRVRPGSCPHRPLFLPPSAAEVTAGRVGRPATRSNRNQPRDATRFFCPGESPLRTGYLNGAGNHLAARCARGKAVGPGCPGPPSLPSRGGHFPFPRPLRARGPGSRSPPRRTRAAAQSRGASPGEAGQADCLRPSPRRPGWRSCRNGCEPDELRNAFPGVASAPALIFSFRHDQPTIIIIQMPPPRPRRPPRGGRPAPQPYPREKP